MPVPPLYTQAPVTDTGPLPPRQASGVCARCRRYTRNGRAEWITRSTGPDYRYIVHADPDDCTQPPDHPDYPDGGQPMALAA